MPDKTCRICQGKRCLKICKLCGLPYDEELHRKLHERYQRGVRWSKGCYTVSKYCNLYCSWLAQPCVVSSYNEERIAKMQNEIALRVARYLYKMIKKEK